MQPLTKEEFALLAGLVQRGMASIADEVKAAVAKIAPEPEPEPEEPAE